VFVALVAPAAADAAGSVRVIKVPLRAASTPAARFVNPTTAAHWTTLRSIRVKGGFSLAGVHWRGTRHALLEIRSARSTGRFGAWQPLDRADLANVAERRRNAPWMSEAAWFGSSARLQIRVRGRVRDLRAIVVKPGPDPTLRVEARANAAQPAILPRAAWGADERLRTGRPVIARRVVAAVVHHTATPNGYASSQVAGIIRSLYLYQTRGNGLADLAFNYLVDAQGRVYEGRYGGIDQNVVGSHTAGFNTGTTGVALIGNFSKSGPPTRQVQALDSLLAWRLDVAHVDPRGRVNITSEGNERFAKGRVVSLPTIFAHRDAGNTDCPGDGVYSKMGQIRAAVAAAGVLKVLNPSVTPPTIAAGAFKPIRFRARLTRSAAWRVLVLTTGGATVARFQGTGAAVDATWDGSVIGGGGLPRSDLLRWRIEAGTARAAEGAFDGSVASGGGGVTGPTATAAVDTLAAGPPVLVNGAAGSVTWRQLKPATVQVLVTTLAGDGVVVLRAPASLPAGPQAIAWNGLRANGTPVPSGHYRYVIRAQPAGAPVETAAVNVDLRRQAAAFAVTTAISPNGDGIADVAAMSFTRNEPGNAEIRLFRGAALVKNVAVLYDQAPGPFTYRWTGVGVPDGSYKVQLLVAGAGGPLDFQVPVLIDTHAPTIRKVSVRKINRLRDVIATVRMSEAATVVVRRGSKVLITRRVTSGVVKLRLSRRLMGRARSLTILGYDGLGNVMPKALKIKIPR
jgi:hypothetical protein